MCVYVLGARSVSCVVCVVCESERESVCVCVRERERVSVCVFGERV